MKLSPYCTNNLLISKTIWSLVFLMSIAFTNSAQSINDNWQGDLEKSLQAFKACEGNSSTKECTKYIGENVKTVYNVNDFYSQKLGRYMVVSEIAEYLENNKGWKLLGKGYEQAALKIAQEHANTNKAVVAIYLNNKGVGNLALILPGELQPSGSWSLQVPNAASFFTSDPSKSFVGKGLSYAFPRSTVMEVLIYGKN